MNAVLNEGAAGEGRLHAFAESGDDAITGATLDGIVLSWNAAAERLYGYSAAEMIGQSIRRVIPDGSVGETLPAFVARIARGERIERYRARRLTRSGLVVLVSLSLSPVYDCGAVVGVSAIARDITGAEGEGESIRRDSEDYRLAFTASPLAMWIYDIATLRVLAVNAAAESQYGYTREQFLGMCVKELHPPAEMAKFRADILRAPTRPRSGLRTRHVRADGSVIDVSVSGSPVRRSSGLARLVVAHDITDEVAAAERADTAQQQQAESLRATIQAMATTIEQRDPYTGGHQRRVAQLAVAIAGRLGLDQETVEGLQLAATIHDIGKIGLPGDVMLHPGRLSPAMFELVKTHSQIGHDIVAGIPFPWPVAEMILQHHERLDGSGYPSGLRAAEILPQAQILAVATSPRP